MYDRTIILDQVSSGHYLPPHTAMSSPSTSGGPAYAMKVEPTTGGNVLS